jgi:hypothetical protein
LLRFVLLKTIYSLGVNSMRTFTANIIILSAQVKDTTITGKAIDGDIAIEFAVANTDVNQRLFVPEAQLVVTGKFRIAKAIATIGAWISSIMAVVSIPAPAEIEAALPEVVDAIEPEVTAEAAVDVEVILDAVVAEVIEPAPLTLAQKRAATLAAKKAAAAELVAC